jgi:hypothetical protein
VSNFNSQEIAADKQGGWSDLPGYYFLFVEVDDHLNESSTDLEDVLFLQLPPDDQVEVVVEVAEDAVEVALVLHDFLEGGDLLNFSMVHEGDVFVFENLLPVGLLVEFLDGDGFSGVDVLGLEEGEPFGLDYALEYTILLHHLNFINPINTIVAIPAHSQTFMDMLLIM